MYSEEIDKICKVCVHANPVKGTITHMKCNVIGGFIPINGVCEKFKYDILKKQVRRHKEFSSQGFTADDFTL